MGLHSKGRVVHCRKEEYDVYIGRGSEWGNPFFIGRHGTRAEVIKKYEVYIRKRLSQEPGLKKALKKLKGKVLACWCPPLDCHGNILIKLISELFKE